MFHTKKILLEIFKHRKILWTLSLQQMRIRYVGTIIGMLWSFVHPLLLMCVLWFVLSVGFKAAAVGGKPSLLIILCGFIVWMFFSEAISNSVQSISANSFLIKKIAFPSEILPITNIIVALFNHFLSFPLFIIMLFYYKVLPGVSILFFLYYLFCLVVFLLGLAWFLASLNVFYKDTSQIVSVLLNIWFWLTPIIWDSSILPSRFKFIIAINPLAYIISGYRYVLLNEVSYQPSMSLTLIFWLITALVWHIGITSFNKLKPNFSDFL